MQKLSDKKITVIHRGGQNVSGPTASPKGLNLFSFFTSPKEGASGKNSVAALKQPVLQNTRPDVPRFNIPAVKQWVALEEKIVHDYKGQKAAPLKNAALLPKTSVMRSVPGPSNPSNQEKKASLASKKGFSFWGLLASPTAKAPVKEPVPVGKDSVLEKPRTDIPSANLMAVKSWVGLEEKIVHDYKEQKTPQFKHPAPLRRIPAKQPLQAFETFTTQTAVAAPRFSNAPRLKTASRGSQRAFPGTAVFLLLVGGLAVGVFLFLPGRANFSGRETSRKLTQLQSEKIQAEQANTALKQTSASQSAEIKWLNSQLDEMALELKTVKSGKVAYEQGLEKKYREELMRITVGYEADIATLRGTVQVQNDIVRALKAQGRAFEKIIDQAGMSALSGVAAGFSQEPFAKSGAVVSVNGRQGFVVINMGAEQGARAGRWITISRSGIELANGRIDRVYPTSSAALLRPAGMLQVIQTGDSVSFS